MFKVGFLLSFCVQLCQSYDNVAFKKDAWQNSQCCPNAYSGASNAVDGNRKQYYKSGSCAISSDNNYNPEWRVNLGSILSIVHVTIYFRTESAWEDTFKTRNYGFYLFVSNTTNKDEGYLCFHDPTRVESIMNISCNQHGRFIILHNKVAKVSSKPHLELCEVEVYGCNNTGYYGEHCNITCPQNCQENRCDIVNGTCLGCIDGYGGQTCDQECSKGKYGLECKNNCSNNCRTEHKCDHINGSCTDGCMPGWRGTRCNEKCDDGSFGLDCSKECSINCKKIKDCDHVTGYCNGGCVSGWTNLLCNKECDGSMYGQNCSNLCGNCRDNTQCHHINGTCFNGCDRGFQGETCTQVCDQTFFGENCAFNCSSNCVNMTCDGVTGVCDEYISTNPDPQTTETSAIVGSTLAVLFIGTCVVLIFIWRRRRYENSKQTAGLRTIEETPGHKVNTKTHTAEYANIALQHECEDDNGKDFVNEETDRSSANLDDMFCQENLYSNDVLDTCMTIAEVQKHISKDRTHNFQNIKAEFAVLPYGMTSPCEVGQKKENVPKNRFKTTFPYDHSRVILKATNSTEDDYINASYIDGVEKKKEYIATQGPKSNTITHFWRMVWQENVTQILMLTNLKEETQVKCTKYWPDGDQDLAVGQFTVKNTDEKMYAFFVKRSFSVISKQDGETKEVTQYHYTAWPDHGTPDPLCLVIFQNHVMKTARNDSNPIVHCSAGIGRTGTYIALDALYKNGLATRSVNVAEYVKKMRTNRMNMVQTPEQYLTIFLCLDEAFKASMKSVKTLDFLDYSNEALSDSPANQDVLRKEFKTLNRIAPQYDERHFQNAVQQAGKQESQLILPHDKYCLYLTSSVPNRGSYINAITAPSFTKRSYFIITLYPSANTVVDFIRLLIDHQSATVVCMDSLSNIHSTDLWFPEKTGFKNIDPFVIIHDSTTNELSNLETTTTVQVKDKNGTSNGRVSFHQPTQKIKDTSSILALTKTLLKSGAEGPVTVMSKDGVSLCGLFCAVFNVIEQINWDNDVDIFTAVRQLQVRRPQLCSSLDEYRLCYKAILEYILHDNTENLYANQ